VRHRLEGLSDEPRRGAPRTITDEQVEKVIVKTLEEAPPDQDTHWSTRSMARATGMSQSAVSRIWRAFGLKQHMEETWKLSTEPQFIEKVRDVVGLYLNPPEKALVLCVDEKAQIQALDRSAPILPILPTTPARRTHDYVRHGTSSLFAAFDLATGKIISAIHRRHRHQEFLKFLKQIDAEVPAELDLHLICDNYGTHKTPVIKNWLLRHPRFHLHFTPTSSSWLNLVERWFAELTNRKLRRSAHRSVASWRPTSEPGSRPGTRIPGRSCGRRLQTRSSKASPDIWRGSTPPGTSLRPESSGGARRADGAEPQPDTPRTCHRYGCDTG
jgi:transposase